MKRTNYALKPLVVMPSGSFAPFSNDISVKPNRINAELQAPSNRINAELQAPSNRINAELQALPYRILLLILFTFLSISLFAIAPVVSNVSAIQRTDGSKIVDIHYDLFDADNDLCDITLNVSANDGSSYDIIPTPANLSGDVGNELPSGTNKHIIWNAGDESYTLNANNYLYRVYVDDYTTPNFVLVEGGTFNNGTSNVTLSSFYIDKYEVTQSSYQTVMGYNPAGGYGGGDTYPVYIVNWFNAIEYCNRRSIAEGITPCYSYLTYGTNPATWPAGWNTSDANHTNVACNWTATGYRLPTEAEWQYAAMGGNQTHNYTYSGSDDVNAVAWYSSNSGSTSHPVGTKAANELGLFDMNGNIREWNWDIDGTYASGAQTNPHGAASGYSRVARGGDWYYDANYCTVSFRWSYSPAGIWTAVIGFRCVRISP